MKYLQAQYSEYDGEQQRFIQGIWGIFGHGNVSGLSQALVEYGQDLPYHQPRNEQSMVHASTGSRAMRRKATMACTTSIGPGATNMMTGAATATICRIPVLLLPSDHYASRYGGVVLQGIEHLNSDDMSVTDAFRVVSRFYDRITRPEQILASLPEAMRIMTSPADTGAVTLALPQDIQGYAYDYPTSFFEPHVWRIERAARSTADQRGDRAARRRPSGRTSSPAAACTTPRPGRSWTSSPPRSVSRSARPTPVVARSVTARRTRCRCRAPASTARRRRRDRGRGRSRAVRRDATARLHHRLEFGVPRSERAVRVGQREWPDAYKLGALPITADAKPRCRH